MEKIIISDTTCLILLTKLGIIEVLQQLFTTVTITPEVRQEFGDTLPEWILVESVSNEQQFSVLRLIVDEGEASAIALSLERINALLVMDERKGRQLAKDLGIQTIGTLGILLEGKLQGYLPALRPLFEKIEQTNFRISRDLLNVILVKANEARML
jgi:predicted nucleic acid-binding protein